MKFQNWLTIVFAISSMPFSSFATNLKKTFCSITINSKEEREVFQSKLDPKKFNFIELTDFASDKKNKSSDWFQKACDSGIQCDALIVSGHFGGSFFGDSGFSLGLNDLERNSCQKRCAGILEKPQEVYLFGCNTLASKEQDHRSPEEYYRALLQSDIQPVEAERIVRARYSPIGFSYKDRMQRVFEGVPLLYGFSSVGPLGKHIKPSLARYLDQIGDYEKHLDSVANGYRDTRTFYRNMRAYTTATSAGLARNDANVSVKTNSCKLNDDSIPIDQRVAHAGDLLASSPHIYFPTVTDFVKRHFSHNSLYEDQNRSDRNKLVRITARTELKDQVLKIADLGGFGPSLQLDLLSFARVVRWLNQEELATRVRAVLKGLLEKPTLQNSDTFCSLESEYEDLLENIDFNGSKLPNNFDFQSAYALRMLGCLKTGDESLTRLALSSARNLNIKNKTLEIQFGLYSALARLPGLEDEVTEFFLSLPPFQGRLAAEANNAIKGLILQKIKGPRQAELYKKYRSEVKKEEERVLLDYYLKENKHLTLESEALIMGFEYQACLLKKEDCNFRSVTWRSEIQDWITRHVDLSLNSDWGELLLNGRQYADSYTIPRLNEKLVEALVNSSLRHSDSNTNKVQLYTAAIANGPLGDQQVKKLAVFYRSLPSTSDSAKPYILHILAQNKDRLDIKDQALLSEPKAHYLCEKTGRHGWSCMTKQY